MKHINKFLLIAVLSVMGMGVGFNALQAAKVVFNVNGGIGNIPPITLTKSGNKYTLASNPNNPTYTGYKFEGWYTESGVEVTIDNQKRITNWDKLKLENFQNGSTYNFYAHWTKDPEPDITFNVNLGSGTNATAKLTHTIGYAGGAQTNTYELEQSVADPTRTGYNFAGWYTDATAGTQVIINTLNEITNWSSLGISVGNTTFYAHWTPRVSQTLTLIDYVNNTNATDTYYELPEPTYANLTFDGWYDANGTKYTVITSSSPAANTTLYAQWTYKVEFINGNNTYQSFSATPFKKLADDDGIEVTTTDVPDPTGNFAGWFTAATGGVKVTLPRTYTGNAIVYAQFGKKCTITKRDYANVTSATVRTSDNGQLTSAQLDAPTAPAGKVFDGWYTQVSGGEKVTTSTVFTSDAAIYARWLYKSYTVVYTTGEFPSSYKISVDGNETTDDSYVVIQVDNGKSGSFTTTNVELSAKDNSGTKIDFTKWRVRGSSLYYTSNATVTITDVRQFASLDTIFMDASWDCNTTVVPDVKVVGGEKNGTEITMPKSSDNSITFSLPDNEDASWYFRDGVNEDEHGGTEEVVPQNDIYIVLDVSNSMGWDLGGGSSHTDGKITRLQGSKDAIKNLLEVIAEKKSDTRVFVLTFAGGYSGSPITMGFPFNGISANGPSGISSCVAQAIMPAITSDNIDAYKYCIDTITCRQGTPTASAMYWAKKVIQAMQAKAGSSRNSYAFIFTDGDPSGINADVQVAESINQANIIKGHDMVTTNATYKKKYGISIKNNPSDKAEKWLDIDNWNTSSAGDINGDYIREEKGLNTTIYSVGMFGSSYTPGSRADSLLSSIASPGCNLGEVDPNVLGDIFSNMFSSIETETYQKIDNFKYQKTGEEYEKTPFDQCGKFQVQVQYKDGCGNWAKSDPYIITVTDPALLAPQVHLYCPADDGVPMKPLAVTKDKDNNTISPIKFEYTYTRDGGTPQQKTMSGNEKYDAVKVPYTDNVSVVYYTKADGYEEDAGCPSQPTNISLVKSTHIVDESANVSDNSAGNSGSCDVAPISGFHYVLIGDNKQSSFPNGYDETNYSTAYQNIRTGEEFVAGISTSTANIDDYEGKTLSMWTAVAPVSGLTYEGKDMVMVPRIFQIDNLGSNTAVDMVLPLTKAEINTLWWYMHGDLTQLGLYKIDNATYSVTNGFTVGNNVVITPYDGATSSSSDINSSLAYQFAVANVALPAQANNNAGPANLQNAMGGTGTYYVMGIKSSNLPVELLYFNAECLGNAIRFAWSTATETNNEYFTIERSEDAIHYKEVARIQGAGTSTMQQDYSFMLDNNTGKTMYYRLRQTDIDGLTEVFEPVAVQCDVEESMDVTMYPVPAMNYVTIQSSMNMAEIQIHNVYGALVNRVEANADKVLVDVSNLANGIYTVKITMANGEQVSRKLIKR